MYTAPVAYPQRTARGPRPERMLVGMSDHSTTELEVTTLVEIAEAAISHHRYADAAEIYARLASAHRGAVGYLARA